MDGTLIDKFFEIINKQELWVQVVAGLIVVSILVAVRYLFKRHKEDSSSGTQNISVKDSPNTFAVQAGRDANVQQDGIMNKVALNKDNPLKTLEVVKDIGKIVDDDPNYKKTISTNADKTSLSFSPRNKDTPQLDGKMHFDCEFPKTKEGFKAWKEIKECFETGKPTVVEGKYLESLKIELEGKQLIPQELLTSKALQKAKLKIGPVEDSKPKPATLIVRTGKHEERLEGLVFYIEQAGSQQITISNKKQAYPLKLRIVLNRNGYSSINFKLTIDEAKTASQAYKILRFLTALKHGTCFELIFPEGEYSIKTREGMQKTLNEFEIYEKYLPLLEKLSFISKSLEEQIPNPYGRVVSKEDIENIENAYLILTKGQIECTVGNLKLVSKREKIKECVEKCKEGQGNIYRIEQKAFIVKILGIKVDMGTCWAEIKPTDKDLEQLSSDIESQKGDIVNTVFLKNKNQKVLLHFEQWGHK